MLVVLVPKNIISSVANGPKRSNLKIANISKTRRKQKNKDMFLARFVNLERDRRSSMAQV